MKRKTRIVISFLNHRLTDGRVLYRETRHLLNTFGDEIEIIAVNLLRRNQKDLIEKNQFIQECEGYKIFCHQICVPENCSVIDKVRWKMKVNKEVYNLLCSINPDLYFIADVREIPVASRLHKEKKVPIIYDSHEDYVRQALDYGTSRVLKHWTARRFDKYEKEHIREFEAVFCTDEFLEKKYSKPVYRAKEVNLLRNFPYYDDNLSGLKREFKETNCLKLVYIGGVDAYRGVIEAASYVKRYNQEHDSKKLCLDIYGNENEISKKICDGEMVVCHGWIDHKDLMDKLRTEYDIGVCLWQPIPKFYTNLPIKNFDYMGAGLSIITSNFGNLKKHAEQSNAGICINPKDYGEFQKAMDVMFEPEKRNAFSENGLNYVRNIASFQKEAESLTRCIKRVLDL